MPYFIQRGNMFMLAEEAAMTNHKTLPKGLYEVQFNPDYGYFLTPRKNKPMPEKLYGSIKSRAKRIINTYNDRIAKLGVGTGVLLSGEKGSGKTLLAQGICHQSPLPTLVVGIPFTDPAFLNLLTAGGPKIVFFDEFEKVYKEHKHQDALLAMLDGHYDTQNLTIATLNDSYGLVTALKNRPSRFYYHYRYENLEDSFVEEYTKDNLVDYTEERLLEIREVILKVWNFNFDMLQALVEEMNRYGEPAAEVIKHINIIPELLGFTYSIELYNPAGERVPLDRDEQKFRNSNPMDIYFYAKIKKTKKDKGIPDYISFTAREDIESNDYGKLTLVDSETRYKCVLTPKFGRYEGPAAQDPAKRDIAA